MSFRAVSLTALLLALPGCLELDEIFDDEEETLSAPNIGFSDDDADDQIIVRQVESGVAWTMLRIVANASSYVRINMGQNHGLAPGMSSPLEGGDIHAGDFLAFCTPTARSLEIRLLHAPSNTVIHAYSFDVIETHQWCSN